MAGGTEPWLTRGTRRAGDFGVFRVSLVERESPLGGAGSFAILEAADWGVAVAVRVVEGKRRLVTVRQYRHGSERVSVEFPGGVVEAGEDPADAALRELREETGYRAGRVTLLGDVSPNPALFTNRFRVYLAEDLRLEGSQTLDEHEIVDVEEIPEEDFLSRLGSPPYDHALMSAAAFLYIRHRGFLR